jgi:hypothetical protein
MQVACFHPSLDRPSAKMGNRGCLLHTERRNATAAAAAPSGGTVGRSANQNGFGPFYRDLCHPLSLS